MLQVLTNNRRYFSSPGVETKSSPLQITARQYRRVGMTLQRNGRAVVGYFVYALAHKPPLTRPPFILPVWARLSSDKGAGTDYGAGPGKLKPTCRRMHNAGSMAAGPETSSGVQREANLLVTLLDLSDSFSRSLQLENPAQQVDKVPKCRHTRSVCVLFVCAAERGPVSG